MYIQQQLKEKTKKHKINTRAEYGMVLYLGSTSVFLLRTAKCKIVCATVYDVDVNPLKTKVTIIQKSVNSEAILFLRNQLGKCI